MPMNQKKRDFARNITLGYTLYDAAVKAGYAPPGAKGKANQLIIDPEVKSYIEGLRSEEKPEQIDPTTIETATEFLLLCMQDRIQPTKAQLDAARSLANIEIAKIRAEAAPKVDARTAEKQKKVIDQNMALLQFSAMTPPPQRVN